MPAKSPSTSPTTCGRERMSWFRKPSSTPLWRDEFSVHTADERYVNRRQFTKFLTLTSFGMLVGNLWILARSACTAAPRIPRMAVAAAGRDCRGRREDVRLSDCRRSLHSGAHRRRFLCRVQPEMHSSLLRGVLRERAEPAGMPLPPGILLDRRWLGAARAAAARLCRASRWTRKGSQLVAIRMEGEGV